MILAAGLTVAFATNVNKSIASGQGGNGSITINDANPDQSYGFYKIFDAIPSADGSSVSYKFVGTAPAAGNTFYTYFSIDDNGNVGIQEAGKDSSDATKLSAAAVSYLNSNYSTLGTLVYTARPGHDGITAENNKYNLTVTGLPYGYYYITTTTGTVVSVDTVKPNATTEDKNPGTSIDKEIAEATGTIKTDANPELDHEEAFAQIGTEVTYTARIPVANGAKNYVFTDTMSDGLTLKADSVKVYVVNSGAAVPTTGDIASGDSGYGTLAAANATGTTADITINFRDAWIKDQVGKDIIVQYVGIVNESALTVGVNGNPNKATINWGDTSQFLHDEDENKVYNAKIGVLKYDASTDSKVPLKGAGFKLYRMNDQTKEYYKWVPGTNGAAPTITWTTDATQATEYITNANGKLTATGEEADTAEKFFEGLRDGEYWLTESTIPDGFNAISDEKVTIAANDYSAGNLTQIKSIDNLKGTVLPSTGGIGTTLFYVGGSILVLAAVILLVTKRRMANND